MVPAQNSHKELVVVAVSDPVVFDINGQEHAAIVTKLTNNRVVEKSVDANGQVVENIKVLDSIGYVDVVVFDLNAKPAEVYRNVAWLSNAPIVVAGDDVPVCYDIREAVPAAVSAADGTSGDVGTPVA
jgi:hypothetical protein